MQSEWLSTALLAGALALAGCAAPDQPPQTAQTPQTPQTPQSKSADVDRAAEEASIYREVTGITEAWSRGDIKAAIAFYAPDSIRVGPMGDVQHGPAEVDAAYEKALHGRFTGAKFTLERGTIRWLSSDVALWQGGCSIALPGDAPPINGHFVHLMKKVNGRWLILEAHPKLFPSMPPH